MFMLCKRFLCNKNLSKPITLSTRFNRHGSAFTYIQLKNHIDDCLEHQKINDMQLKQKQHLNDIVVASCFLSAD